MPRFRQIVAETRLYRVEYEVAARDEKQAAEKIAIGDTISETDLELESVLDRTSHGALERVPVKKKGRKK